MEQKRALARLVEGLRPGMEENGFSSQGSRNIFVRENHDKQDIVAPVVVGKSAGRIGLLYGARVRFPVVERLIHGDEVANNRLSGSYGGLSHLIAGQGYFDWTVASEDGILDASKALLANVVTVALPFFKNHMGLEDILTSLCDRRRLLGLSTEDQVVYRAAILWLLDRRYDARALLIEALEERRDQLPKKHIQISNFLRKLE